MQTLFYIVSEISKVKERISELRNIWKMLLYIFVLGHIFQKIKIFFTILFSLITLIDNLYTVVTKYYFITIFYKYIVTIRFLVRDRTRQNDKQSLVAVQIIIKCRKCKLVHLTFSVLLQNICNFNYIKIVKNFCFLSGGACLVQTILEKLKLVFIDI